MTNKDKLVSLFQRALANPRVRMGKFMTEKEYISTLTNDKYFAYGYSRVNTYDAYAYCFEKNEHGQWMPINTRKYIGPFKEDALIHQTSEFIRINLDSSVTNSLDTIEIFKVESLDYNEIGTVIIVKDSLFSSSQGIETKEFQKTLEVRYGIMINSDAKERETLSKEEFDSLKTQFLNEGEHRRRPAGVLDRYLKEFPETSISEAVA